MSKIKLLIVDDEPLAHKVLEDYCKKIDEVEVVGNCYDGVSTLNFLNKQAVDALLLDIQMPDLTGFELLDSLKNNAPKVIFTTAYTDYALQGFDYDQVVDYLHKPIRIARFIKALQRLKKQLQLEREFETQSIPETTTPKVENAEYISLKDNKIVYKIKLTDINYVQSWGNYLKVFLANDEMKIVRKTISAMEQDLPNHLFERIHKSYIVNVHKVASLEGNQVMVGGVLLPVGKVYQLKAKARILG